MERERKFLTNFKLIIHSTFAVSYLYTEMDQRLDELQCRLDGEQTVNE